VAKLSAEERQEALQRLAARLHGWHMAGVAQLLFSVGQGASIVSSQLLLMMQPLAPAAPMRQALGIYAAALEDDASWQELIGYLRALQS
jgi:hypothetical protein